MSGERDGAMARRWWMELTNEKRGDRGALARLRRCHSAVDASTEVAAIDLARRLERTSRSMFLDALGLATVLAEVREDTSVRLMLAAGWPHFPGDREKTDSAERPLVSELRFRRLLQTSRDEKIDSFRRLVRMLGGKVDVRDLAESFLWWGDEIKQRWAFEYFAAGQSAPPRTGPAEGVEP